MEQEPTVLTVCANNESSNVVNEPRRFSIQALRRCSCLVTALIVVALATKWCAQLAYQSTLNARLVQAVRTSDVAAVNTLLASGADPNTTVRQPGMPSFKDLLTIAVRRENHDSWHKSLLETALARPATSSAEAKRNNEIVELLCDRGANTLVTFSNGSTPLLERFEPHLCIGTASMLVIPREDLTLTRSILKGSQQLEQRDCNQMTALMLAHHFRCMKSVQLLVAAGAIR